MYLTKETFVFQCDQERHYSFSGIGFAVVANQRAFLKIPLSISPIQKQIRQSHILCSKIRKLATRLGDTSIGGLQVNSLSYACDGRYKILNQKFETVTHYYTRKNKYDPTQIFKQLDHRSIPINMIIPDYTLNHPRFLKNSQNTVPFMWDKKTIETEDDKIEESIVETEGSGDAEPEGDEAMAENESEVESSVAEPEPNDDSVVEDGNDGDEAFNEPPSFKDLWNGNPDIDDFENPFEEDFANNEVSNNNNPRPLIKRNAPPPPNSSSPTHFQLVSHEKSKRQIVMGLLAGIAGAVGINSLFGGSRASQINTLDNEMQNLASKQNVIIAQLEDNSEAIMVNRQMTDGLKNLTIKTAKFAESEHFLTHGLLLFTLIDSEFNRIEDALQTHVQIIEAAQSHNFHPAILTYDGSVAAFEQVKATAEKNNLVPVIQTPQQLSQMYTSFSYTKKGITILVEIPLASQDSVFSLHQFHAMPISLSPNAYVQLISNAPIVGIGKPDLSGKPLFIEMSYADLAQCHHFSDQVFLCTQQRKIQKPESPSCVYSLYHRDHQAAEHSCVMNLKGHSHDHAIATGPNEFTYFSNQSSTYLIICQNHSRSSHQKLRGTSTIIVPSGCHIESSQFILYPQSDYEIPIHHEVYSWSNPALTLIANDSNINTIDEAIAALDNVKGAPALDPESLRRFQRLKEPFYHQYPISFTSIILAGVTFLLILWFVSIWVRRNYIANRDIRRSKSAKYQGQQFIENHENIEFLKALKEKHAEDKSS